MVSLTVQHVAVKLFQYFIVNNTFDLAQNHSDIFEVSIDPALERAVLLKSLEKFEEQKILTRLDVEGNPVFVLNQALQSYNQQIAISGLTAANLATVVNAWLEENGKADYLVNSMEINEWTIQVLTHIAETALAQSN